MNVFKKAYLLSNRYFTIDRTLVPVFFNIYKCPECKSFLFKNLLADKRQNILCIEAKCVNCNSNTLLGYQLKDMDDTSCYKEVHLITL